MVKIYQLKEEHFDKAFMTYSQIMKTYGKPDMDWYDQVYEMEENHSLEDLFYIFNMQRPEDFKGHSLSVSDVVDIDGHTFYCDMIGWKVI